MSSHVLNAAARAASIWRAELRPPVDFLDHPRITTGAMARHPVFRHDAILGSMPTRHPVLCENRLQRRKLEEARYLRLNAEVRTPQTTAVRS